MAININNLPNSNQIKQKLDQQTQVKQQATQANASVEQSKMSSKDSVSFTAQAKQISDIEKKAQEAPALNKKKIEAIKKAIADGEYKVDAGKLAKSMMSFEYDLFDK